MTKDGARRYAEARALVVRGVRAGIVLMRFYNKQTRSRSLKVIVGGWFVNAEVRRAIATFDIRMRRLADRVDTSTSHGSTYYFV